jgi:hypothetical protein
MDLKIKGHAFGGNDGDAIAATNVTELLSALARVRAGFHDTSGGPAHGHVKIEATAADLSLIGAEKDRYNIWRWTAPDGYVCVCRSTDTLNEPSRPMAELTYEQASPTIYELWHKSIVGGTVVIGFLERGTELHLRVLSRGAYKPPHLQWAVSHVDGRALGRCHTHAQAREMITKDCGVSQNEIGWHETPDSELNGYHFRHERGGHYLVQEHLEPLPEEATYTLHLVRAGSYGEIPQPDFGPSNLI